MKCAEQTWFVWTVLLHHSCVQIAQVTANARSEFSARSLEHAIKRTLHESVWFSTIKKRRLCIFAANSQYQMNLYIYEHTHVCLFIHMTMSPEILLRFNLVVHLNSKPQKEASGALSSRGRK